MYKVFNKTMVKIYRFRGLLLFIGSYETIIQLNIDEKGHECRLKKRKRSRYVNVKSYIKEV